MNNEPIHNGQKTSKANGTAQRRATVLQVIPKLGRSGGVERGTVEIASAIVQAGGRAIVASAGGIREHDLHRVGAEHITLPVNTKNPIRMFNNIRRLADIILHENVDIIHARSRAPAWSALYAAKRTQIPYVSTFHGTYGRGNPFKRFYNSAITKGERVIAISNFIAAHIRQYYGVPSERIHTIHRGVDLSMFNTASVSAERVISLANEWRIVDGHPVVMLPGRMTRWKGQTTFIAAIARLNRRDIRCVLVGGEQGRKEFRLELENLVEKYNLGEVIRIVESCTDMPAAYMLSDVVVSASTDPEAFGRIIIEAQALGRPIIATDHGGAKETVIENETGWLIPPNDPNALAEAIEHAIDLDKTSRTTLADMAIKNVQDNFSLETMCRKTLDLYDEVLKTRNGA